MNYNGSVLLSLVEDKENVLPTIAAKGCTVIQAPDDLIKKFNDFVLDSRSFYRIIEGYTDIFQAIVALERETLRDTEHQRFHGIIVRNRNINTAVVHYFTSKMKEAGYGMVFSEQKRSARKGSDPEYIPSYFITFDFN